MSFDRIFEFNLKNKFNQEMYYDISNCRNLNMSFLNGKNIYESIFFEHMLCCEKLLHRNYYMVYENYIFV